MAMREECKHFQSRTYSDGETARFCVLDLAPDAPWRCPDDCSSYERRMADAGWTHGSLVEPKLEDEPEPPRPESLGMLEEAEDIVNAAGPDIVQEVERQEQASAASGLRRWLRRRRG